MNEKIPHITESALHFLYLHTCGWCRKRTTKDKKVFDTDSKFVEGVDFKKYEGRIVPLALTGVPHSVLALVKAGNILTFNFCASTCTDSFKAFKNSFTHREPPVVNNVSEDASNNSI